MESSGKPAGGGFRGLDDTKDGTSDGAKHDAAATAAARLQCGPVRPAFGAGPHRLVDRPALLRMGHAVPARKRRARAAGLGVSAA